MRPSDLATVARIRAELKSGEARRAREALGIYAAEIAAVIGVSRASVHYWETGKAVPSAVHALAYSRAIAAVVSGLAA